MKQGQRGNTLVGIIIGVVLGLAAALAVAVYVTKVPIPFLNKGQNRTPEQDAAELRKNRDWDPNAALYGRNAAKPIAPPAPQASQAPGAGNAQPLSPLTRIPAPAVLGPDKTPPAVTGRPADPLGEFATAKAAAGTDPFLYFVQAGAFRTPEDAEAQRAKLAILGFDAKVSEREQAGRQVWRVRVGPFDKKDDADRQKQKLESGGVETALVRVQR